MGRVGTLRLGFALLILVLSIFERAATQGDCRSGCHGTPQHFKYVDSTTYKYNLESTVEISLSSAEGHSSTKLKATVLLTQLPKCDQLLRLENVQIIGSDAKKYSHVVGLEHPIRINFHDGHVEDSICTVPGDNQNSLNIKRAVASLFQAAIGRHYETDVFGVCPTEIVTRKEGVNLVVQKSRNLNKCSHRETVKQDFMATSFNLNSEFKSSPILSGEYSSEQKMKNGILDQAFVTENYLYVPFSVGKSGAKAHVATKLQFVGSAKEAPPQTACARPKSIIFENPHLITAENSNVDSILAALKDTKSTIDVTVGAHTAKHFADLIKILRVSKKDDILAVYGQVRAGAGFKDKVGTKTVFLDALFRAGTGDTIEVGIELLKNNELSPIEQKLVYFGLAFVKHATLPSIAAATALLDQPDLSREAYLGIGTLAGRYCREHSCEGVAEIERLSQKLISKLGDGKTTDRRIEDETIKILKALGNIEILSDAVAAKIIAIAQDKKASNRLRVVALDTYMVDACKDKFRDSALGILKDIQQDSEIRIKAYLVLAKCPNGKIAKALKNLLDNEPSYQVGGFIVSHLRNLRASADPEKALAKQHLGQVITTQKFPIDPRKYSFNNEFSYAIESLGIANTVESDVVFSHNSFLPRSTIFNFTAHMFGHEFNFLEIQTRQENLDKLMEHYLGPLGVLNKESPDELASSGKLSLEKILHHLKQRVAKTRGKRDVPKGDIDNIGKQVQIKTNALNNDLDLDLSLKIFGSELLFLSINDESRKFTPDSIIDTIFDALDESINKAKNFEKVIQSNLLFLDSEFSYPTSIGFPLRLAVEGISSIQIKTAAQIDIVNMFGPHARPFKFSLVPSANIDITGSMTLDAQAFECGLKVTSSLYTATGGELEVVVTDEGKGVDIKFSVPVEKQKIISATHDIVFHSRELGHPEVVAPIKFGQNKDFSICMDQLSPIIGLTFCADINNPLTTSKTAVALPFPLSGNAKFSVEIQREDVSYYHYKHVLHKDEHKLGGEFILETIGANNDRKLALEVTGYAYPETFLKATLVSSLKSASAEARVNNNDQEKSISVEFQHDNQHMLGKIGVSVAKVPGKTVYQPLIQFNVPGVKGQKMPISVEGSVIVEEIQGGFRYIFDNIKAVAPNKVLTVHGHVEQAAGGFSSDITVGDGHHEGCLKGKLQVERQLLKLNAEITNTYNPHANLNIKYDYKSQHEPLQIDSSLQVIHGVDLASKTNKLTFSTSLFRRQSGDNFESKAAVKFAYPLLKTDNKLEFSVTPKVLKYDVEIQYGELKFGSELDAKVGEKVKGDHDVCFEIYGFDNKMEIKLKREITGDKSKIDNSLEINGKKLEVTGLITHHYKTDDINIGADLIIKIPGRAEDFKVVNGFVLNQKELDTHLKISAGAHMYVDCFLKGTNDGNANGSIKVTLKDFVVANGVLRVAKGVGSGHILIEFVKMHRKIKAETTFTIAAPTYDIVLTLHPNFEKDADKLVFSTCNQVKPGDIDSKNFIEVSGHKLEVNFKGALDGKINNGKLTYDVEIILPTQHYYAHKLMREFHVVEGIANGKVSSSFEQRVNKNVPGGKLIIEGKLHDANLNERLFDVTYHITAENGHGKNFNAAIELKRRLIDEHINIDGKLQVEGSALAHPIQATVNGKYKDLSGSYKIETKCGPKIVFNIDGKYDVNEENKKIEGELNFGIETPSNAIRTIKFSTSGALAKPTDEWKVKGAVALFVDDDGSNPDATIDIKFDGDAHVAPQKGNVKVSGQFQKADPVGADFNYDVSEENEVKKLNGHVSIHYSRDKVVNSDLIVVRPNENEYKVELKLDSPQTPGAKLEVYTKKSPDGKTINSEIALTANNKRFVLTNELHLSNISPSIDVKLALPNGKIDRIAAHMNKISDNEFGGDLKLEFSETNFAFDGTLNANIDNIDNFFIKITADSPSLKLDKVLFEAQNKPAKAGKRIQVTTKTGGKNFITGSTSYKAHEERGKYIVEGSGSFKIREETKQANFKFIRQNLVASKDGEDGFDASFNAGIGNQAVDAELKVTNRQFRIMNSFCEENKQCAHIEIDSKTSNPFAKEFNHEIEIAVDLRNVGLSHEFGLKGVTTRKHFVLDHTVDIYFQSKENKYQYSLYVHPDEAGAQLITPKRVIAIEGTVHLPKQRNDEIRGELALYLNKKAKPTEKTALWGVMRCNGEIVNADCNAEVKFTNPGLGKDLSVSYVTRYDSSQKTVNYDLVVDVSPNPNQKVTISGKAHTNVAGGPGGVFDAFELVEAKCEGLNVYAKYERKLNVDSKTKAIHYSYCVDYDIAGAKYDSGVFFDVEPTHASLVIKALNKEIVHGQARIQSTPERCDADGELSIIGISPLIGHVELEHHKSLKCEVSHKATPNDKVLLIASYVSGKIAECRAEAIQGGASHPLFHASVKLDDVNFLKSDFGYKSEHVDKFVNSNIRKDFSGFAKELKATMSVALKDCQDQAKHVTELAKQNAPNFQPLREYYRRELQTLRDELLSDKTIKEVGEFLRGVFGALVHSIDEFLSHTNDAMEKIAVALQQQFGNVIQVVNKELVPKLNEIAQGFVKVGADVCEQLVDVLFECLAKIGSFIEGHEAEIKEVAAAVAGITEDLGRFTYKFVRRAQEVAAKEWEELYQYLAKLPIAEEIKLRCKQLFGDVTVPDAVINTFKETMITLRDAVPSADAKKLIVAVADYVEKKMRGQPVDDLVAIRHIAALIVESLGKLLSALGEAEYQTGTSHQSWQFPLASLPRLGSMSFSPISYLLRGDFPAVSEVLQGLSLNPSHLIPPYELHAVLVQGQHIFTFDGKHLTFPGNCNYLLARDAVNGNFSLVGTFTDGILTAITFADKTNTVTLKKGGQLQLNNAATEYPVHKPHLDAFRLYDTVNIWSKAGVEVHCSLELTVCGIHVSGFYHAQLRGLLGNGNAEPYDDYTLPNGKIVTSESDFGNAYKMGASCAAVTTVDHATHHRNPACTKLFDRESPLSICYKFVDPQNYRTACDHGVAAGVPETERYIAFGYVSSCRSRFVPVAVPSQFAKCENAETPFSVGDTFSVKTPAKAADIVIAVDQRKENEVIYKELVQAVVAQISTELNSKGITDVDFHLVGYGGEYQRYPSHYTVGGKLTFKGKCPNLKFTEELKSTPFTFGCHHSDSILEFLRMVVEEAELITGQTLQQRTYTEILNYPFRAHAVKSIIAVVGEPCDQGKIAGVQKLVSRLFADRRISLNLITPFDAFHAKDAKQTKNVIGFNSHHVFTFGEAKKKPEGTSELHDHLDYQDYCVDFTLENRGNVFVTNNFLLAKGPARKQFAQVVAHNIVEQMINVEQELDCECQLVSPYAAENRCKVSHTKSRVVPGKKGGQKT